MRQRQARHQRPRLIVGSGHRRPDPAVERDLAFPAVELRPRPPAPEREDAAPARLAVHDEGRAGLQTAASEAPPEVSAPVQPAVGSGHAPHRIRPSEQLVRSAHRRPAGQARCPERTSAGNRRDRHGVVDARTSPIRPDRWSKLAEELDRHLAHHARPQLPPRKLGLEAHLARRLDPFLHLLHHVYRRRPAEPGHKRPRHRIGVLDRAGRLGVRHASARGVGQP